jgi:UDP-N-acetyl-2-amino-2-deoxyglucuronate dehydrogenase
MAGTLRLERANVRWLLSIDEEDLPATYREQGRFAFRSIIIDGQELEFSEGFTDLHTRVYAEIMASNGFGIKDARPWIELVHLINNSEIVFAPYDLTFARIR